MGPAEVFKKAQKAAATGNWPVFFRCLSKHNVLKILENAINIAFSRILIDDPRYVECFNKYSFDLDNLKEWYMYGQIKKYKTAVSERLNSVTDVTNFVIELEILNRKYANGGSIASTIFKGETVEIVSLQKKSAWGIRIKNDDDEVDPIEFINEGNEWLISILPDAQTMQKFRKYQNELLTGNTPKRK